MRKLNKLWLGSIMFLLLFIVSACSSEDSANSDASESSTDDDVFEINIAYNNQPDEPVGILAEKWKELVEEESDGRIKFNLYPSGQLGAEQDVIEQARMGNNVITLGGYGFLMNYVPDAGILDAPYIVESFDDFHYLTTTDWFEEIKSDLRDENIELLIPDVAYGERHLMTNEKVLTPEDLKGKKIRVPDTQIAIETFEAIGASPTPTPLNDLYTSLQQGLVVGAENPLPVLQGVQAQEVSKNLSLTGHQRFVLAWMGGADYIDSLPDDILEILMDTGIEARDYGEEVLEEQTEEILTEFEEEGVEVHEVDASLFKESVKDVYDQFPEWTPGLYDTLQDLLENR